MLSRLIPLCILLFGCFPSFGQDPKSECPTIDVYGPPGLTQPNDAMTFSVSLGKGAEKYALEYHWSTIAGEIISGQGTTSVQIKWSQQATLVVTIEVTGLPKNCPTTESEYGFGPRPPEAVRVGFISSFKGNDHEQVLKKFAEELQLYPSNQGHVIVGSRQESVPTELQDREIRIVEYLKGLAGYDPQRLTLVRWLGKVDIVELWRVPPGAENPTCRDCDTKVECPKITVTGPAGIVQPGDVARFTVNVENGSRGFLKYRWTVSGGVITEGQGNPWIDVQTSRGQNRTRLTATVEIEGLSAGCSNTYSGTAEIFKPGHPQMIANAESYSWPAIKKELDQASAEFLRSPTHIFYLVVYVPSRSEPKAITLQRQNQIKKYLMSRYNIVESRIVVVSGGESSRFSMSIYGVPPDAEKPAR